MQESTLSAAPSSAPSPSPPTTAAAAAAGGAVPGGHPHPHPHPHGNDAQQSEEEQNSRRRASVEAEVYRMKQLPVSSNYAAHRLRVLGKVMHLLSLPPKVCMSSTTIVPYILG